MIQMTESGKQYLQTVLAKHPGQYLRIYLSAG